ncbi:hypothetical protein LZ30DRAFT_700500 [Colletotrichum cereale]|nr:hypothetical protein LZ30DRAFT_700500 [Colletotrichum cereale]
MECPTHQRHRGVSQSSSPRPELGNSSLSTMPCWGLAHSIGAKRPPLSAKRAGGLVGMFLGLVVSWRAGSQSAVETGIEMMERDKEKKAPKNKTEGTNEKQRNQTENMGFCVFWIPWAIGHSIKIDDATGGPCHRGSITGSQIPVQSFVPPSILCHPMPSHTHMFLAVLSRR